MNIAQASRTIEYIRRKYLSRNGEVEFDAEWEEKLHPRAENGQFTSGSGGPASSAEGGNDTGGATEGKVNKPGLSEEMKPKNNGYNMSLEDGFMTFQRKNGGNSRRPSPLYNLFNEVEDSGGDGMQAVEDEYYKTRLSMCTEGLKEIDNDEAYGTLLDEIDPGVRQQWMMEYNHEIKPRFVYEMTKSPEVHNAALNVMYANYKDNCKDEKKEPLSFEDFLVTPMKMYRGGSGKEYKKASPFSSYTFRKEVAEKFKASETGHGEASDDGVVYEAEIRPIDTYGSINNSGEMEVFVPRNIAPNGNRDEEDVQHEDFEESKHPRGKDGKFKAGASYSVNAKHKIKPGDGYKSGSYSVNAAHKIKPGGSDAEKRLRKKNELKSEKIRARHADPWR